MPADDKQLHFLVGALISLFFGLLLTPWTGVGIALLIGILKEIYDKYHPKHDAEIMDILWTLSGGAFSWMLIKIILTYKEFV